MILAIRPPQSGKSCSNRRSGSIVSRIDVELSENRPRMARTRCCTAELRTN